MIAVRLPGPRTREQRTAAATIVVAALAGCSGRAAPTTCDGDLRGVYADIDAGGARWMLLDHGATLEAYPLFDDAVRDGELTGAPRVLDLTRTGGPGGAQLGGTLSRRYEQAGAMCRTSAPAHVVGCTADGLALVHATPTPPLEFLPCRPGRPLPSRRSRWVRRP